MSVCAPPQCAVLWVPVLILMLVLVVLVLVCWCCRLQIPTNRVKLMVGPGGETIKNIQRKSK